MAINPNAPTSAKLCKERGWGPGTLLIGDEGYGPTVIRITAVGEQEILAVIVSHNDEYYFDAAERQWTLLLREWKEYKDVREAPADQG